MTSECLHEGADSDEEDLGSLDQMNVFLESVGKQLGEGSPERLGHEGGGGVGPPQLVLLQLLRVLPPKHPPLRAKHQQEQQEHPSRRPGSGGRVRTMSIRVDGECAAYGRGRLGFLDSSFSRLHAPPRATLRAHSPDAQMIQEAGGTDRGGEGTGCRL